MKVILCAALCWIIAVKGKRKSEYTQKDWDRVAREWEREEMEEDERERKEALDKGPGITFDPKGNIDTEQLMAQSKRGKPTMVFFNVREKMCKSEEELTKLTTKWASLLLNGNVPVQNFPVSPTRGIFMVQDGSLSYQVKNFLLTQNEVESVSIDQQEWQADGDGTPNYPGQDKTKKESSGDKAQKTEPKSKKEETHDNMTDEKKDKKSKSKEEVHNTVQMTDEELAKKLVKDSGKGMKSPKPQSEESNEIPDFKNDVRSDNDVKSEL